MALWPAATVADLDGLLRFYAVPAEVWQAFATAAGDPPDLRPLACLPAPAVVEATTSATTSTGRRLTMVEAIQVGLVYRAAHRFLHLAAGGEMDSWRDPDPWGANPAGVAATSSRATGAPTANLGEKKVKFSNVLEQGDDTEFVLDEALNKAPLHPVCAGDGWNAGGPGRSHVGTVSGDGQEGEDPAAAAVRGFRYLVAVRQEALEDAKVQVLRGDARRLLHHEDGAGACLFSTLAVELQGPANHVGDDGSGGAGKLDAVGEQNRDAEPPLRKLLASDSGGEQMAKTFSKVKMAIDAGESPPRGWDVDKPWQVVWRLVLNDQDYWPYQRWFGWQKDPKVQPCPPTRRS